MRRGFGVAMMAGLLSGEVSSAATIRVPEDSPTVLAAVDLAMPGDSVLVGPGTWTDSATRLVVTRDGNQVITACAFSRGGVVIRGQGAGVSTLDVATGSFVSDVVFVERMGEGPLRMEALTLTGVGPVGHAVVGLYCNGVELRSCRFEGNTNSTGAAVGVRECAVTMEDCDLVGNDSPAGLLSIFDAQLHLSRCRFEGNLGRVVQTDNSNDFVPTVIEDCEFIRNRGRGFGTCLNIQSTLGYVIEGSLFLENVAELDQVGAAVRVSGGSGEIRNNVFAYDSCYAASSRGAGIRWEQTQGSVLNNTFVGCYTTLGGAAFAGVQSSVTFRGNVVAHCGRGSAVSASSSVVTGNSCNLYWANTGGNFENWTPSPTDVFADPLFCDLIGLDFTVRNDSPCLNPPTPSCAPIGALGIGCGIVSVEPSSFGRVKALFR